MAEHTPTPWIVCHPTPSHQATRGWIKSVCKGFPERMVAQATGQETTEEREANAAFIVKAVNNHEAMDKLLAEAADYLNTHNGMDGMDLGNKITQFRLRMQADLIAPRHT